MSHVPCPKRIAIVLVFAMLSASGCIRRQLTIRSEPAGALAYLNDQLIGPTPVTFDFQWYGWHRLTLRKDGYERVDDRKQLRSPVYFWIPLDLVMELLPVRVRDTREWSYALHPMPQESSPVAPPDAAPPPAEPATTGETP